MFKFNSITSKDNALANISEFLKTCLPVLNKINKLSILISLLFILKAGIGFSQSKSNHPYINIRANSVNDEDKYDETVIIINENCTMNYDSKYDCQKLLNTDPDYPNLYSFCDNVKKLAVNSIPDFSNNTVLNLGLMVSKAGDYIFNCTITDFPPDIKVLIEDRLTGTFQDLTVNPVYHFKFDSIIDNERFKLHFFNDNTTGISENNSISRISSYISANTLHIQNSTDNQVKLTLFDIQGRVLITSRQLSVGENNININAAKGLYLLKIDNNKKVVIKKVIIQ